MVEKSESPSPTTRFRLSIAYEGTNFTGWARQPGIRTVQGELEAALATVFRRFGPAPTLTVAGRTDAGVHATGQVAHLNLTEAQLAHVGTPHGRGAAAQQPTLALAKRLNGLAGGAGDLYVAEVTVAPPGFDARFSPLFRRYEYRIADLTARRDPLLRHHTLWYPAPLDIDAMNEAARQLLGLHDWAAYCRPRPGATTIRELQECHWRRDETGVLIATLKADAFCHSMVRAVVGSMVSVGEAKLASERLMGILSEARRTSEFKVMPAAGLTLIEVGYPVDAEVGLRAQHTRARRRVEHAGDGLTQGPPAA